MIRQIQWKLVDNLKRKLFIKYELKYLLLRSLFVSLDKSYIIRTYWQYKLVLLPKFGLIIKHNNRCLTSGRNKNILMKTKSSRFFFRLNINFGNNPSLRKLTW